MRRSLAVLVILATASAGLYLGFFAGSSAALVVQGTTPSARRIAALVAQRAINAPGNKVSSARCWTAGYAGYRCAVGSNAGRFVCDANASLTESALLENPVVGDRLTLLMCDTDAHYKASEALTGSLAKDSLETINGNARAEAALQRWARHSTSTYCRVYRLRSGRTMTRVMEVTLAMFVGQPPTARQVGGGEFDVLPNRAVRQGRQVGLVEPLAAWSRCEYSPQSGIALQRGLDEVWPVLYTKEDPSTN